MRSLIMRDLKLAARSGGSWLLGIAFFLVFLALSAIALGGEQSLLRPLAAALIWLAVILSALMSSAAILSDDFGDRTLEQLKLSGISTLSISASKSVSFFITALLPLIVMTPVAAIAFGLEVKFLSGLIFAILLASPAIAVYGVFASAVMAGRGKSGFLVILMTAPFLIPILIFGLGAVDSFAQNGIFASEFRALAGLSLIGCAAGLPAAGAAINTNLE